MLAIVVTFDVFQPPIAVVRGLPPLSKSIAPANMLFIATTFAVFQPSRSWLNEVAPRKVLARSVTVLGRSVGTDARFVSPSKALLRLVRLTPSQFVTAVREQSGLLSAGFAVPNWGTVPVM